MGLFDHLLALMILVLPTWSAWKQLPLLIAEIERGHTALRARIYVMVAIQQTVFGVLLIGYWALAGRSFSALGLRLDANALRGVWLAGTVVFCIVWVTVHSWLLRGERGRRWLRRRSGRVLSFLPHTTGERNRFLLLSLSAGVWEEIFFRGFLLWYLKPFVGVWAAVAVSSVVFASAHIYQGWDNALIIAGLGLVFAASLVATGSLVLAVLMHVVVDANAAFTAYRLHNAPEAVAPAG